MKLVGHFLGSDLSMLVRNGYDLPDNVEYLDTHVAAKMVYPDQAEFDLEHLTLRSTPMGCWRPNLKKLDGEDFDAMADDALSRRCGNDAEASIRLARILEPEIHRLGLSRVWGLAMEALPVLARVGGTGMSLNRDELRTRVLRLGGDPDKASPGWVQDEFNALQTALGVKNLRSDQQVAEALYGRLGAVPLDITSKGYSVGKKCLLWARYHARDQGDHELERLLDRLLEFNSKDKLYSTYYQPWYTTGGMRVHCSYNIGGAATGRLSSSDVNLQNIPLAARTLVVPSDGYDYLLQADFCLGRGTRVLTSDLRWVTIETVQPGDELVGFDEHLRGAKLRRATVEKTRTLIQPSFRIVTDHGTVVSSSQHQWVCTRNGRREWVLAKDLIVGDRLAFFADPWEFDDSRDAGYLAGFLDGEGFINGRCGVGFGQNPGPTMDRVCALLEDRGYVLRKSKTSKWKCEQVRLFGNRQGLRLVGSVRPHRLLEKASKTWEGQKTWGRRTPKVTILSIEPLGPIEVFAVQTSTRTLIAEGFLTHNSMLEMRGAAELSLDPLMTKWIVEGKDLHSIMAARVAGLPEPITKKDFERFKEDHYSERATGKMSNFACLYGIEGSSLLWKVFADTDGKILIDEDTANSYVENFFKTFAGYKAYIDHLLEKLQRGEVITSPFGRKWWFPPNKAGWRKSQNYPIQSTASDITVLALLTLDRILRRDGWKSRLIGEVHDSIVLETTRSEIQALAALVKKIFENPDTKPFGFTLKVPLRVDLQYGTSWGELLDFGMYGS